MGNLSISNGGIKANKEGMASVDLRYGPYESISAAHAALDADGICAVGLTVGIISGTSITEYWYQGGTSESNLVKKQSDVTIDAYTKQESDTKYQPKGSYQPAGDYATEQQLAGKVDKETGKGLSTNDYTNEEKQKVGNALVPADIVGKANKDEVYTKTESDNKYQPKGSYATQLQLDGKVDKVPGKGLSTNDYTNEDKAKVAAAITEHQDISGKADKSEVNAALEWKADVRSTYTKAETYSKQEVNSLITTPNQEYVTVTATAQTTDVTQVLPTTGESDTVYRVGNWDGTQYDNTYYSEYAWNGTNYIFLSRFEGNALDANYVDNPEYLALWTDAANQILVGVRKDGDVYFGAGVPNQLKDYIAQKLEEFSPEPGGDYQEIIDFLGGLLDSGMTLQELLNEKVEKEAGKGLIDSVVSESFESLNNPEWEQLTLDKDGKILEGTKKGCRKEVFTDVHYPNGIPSEIKEYTDAQVKELRDTIGEIVQNIDDVKLPALPDYYFENGYLDNKIKFINEKIRECSNNGDIFFWITDIHWEADRNTRLAPSLINYIRQRTNIPRLFNGGDNYDGLWGTYRPSDKFDGNIDLTCKLRKALGSDKVYTIIGNHEVITYNTYPEIFYAIRQHNDDVVYGDADKSYFYVDNTQQKIRYVILTSFGVHKEGSDQYFSNEFKNNPDQLDWLMRDALDLGNDWTVVIFIHGLFHYYRDGDNRPYHPHIIPLFNSRKVAWQEAWPFENVWIDAITHYTSEKFGVVIDHDPRPLDGQGNVDESLAEVVTVSGGIPAIADKFMLYSPNNNNTYNKYVARVNWHSATQTWRLVWTEYGTYKSDTAHNIGDEIMLWKGFNGKIAGVIHGHNHSDRIIVEEGIPFIISACDRWMNANDLNVTRTPGTISEQHFEVVVLNKTLKKWTVIAIGAPARDGVGDSEGNEVQYREVSYV